MVRTPCCDKMGVKTGPWTAEEDQVLIAYVQAHGHGNWRAFPKKAGLNRCGKSCRLRWTNYLRPDLKRGNFTMDEETIIRLHAELGNRWSAIAAQLPGRTDNEIKNVWHTYLKKLLPQKGAEHEEEVRRQSRKTVQPSSQVSLSPASLVVNQHHQQPLSDTHLLRSLTAEEEPATSSSSSWDSSLRGFSDEIVEFPSVDVLDLDDAFWTETLAMDIPPADDTPAALRTCDSGTLATAIDGYVWPQTATTTHSSYCGATTCRPDETPFEDGMNFWLRLLAESGNLQRF